MNIITKTNVVIPQFKVITRAFNNTPALCTQQWRVQKGLCANRMSEGILTDGPDFTYLDGRPTPLLQRQKKRIQLQREYASKIVEMCHELDFAKQRQKDIQAAKEKERQDIIANRLKPKGMALNKK